MTDYGVYIYSKAEMVRYGTAGVLSSCFILMLFYRSFLISIFFSIPIGILFLRYYKRTLLERRRKQLSVSFKDLLESLVSALSAGYSMENAMAAAKKDLLLIYEEESLIICELKYMAQKLGLGYGMGQVLTEWGERSGLEEIADFARIYTTAKRTGGNLVAIMRQTGKSISEKIELRREIETMIAGKKLESKFMSAVPLLILIYLQVCSPEFLDPLYEGILGRVVMTGALVIYAVSYLWIKRIINIDF